MSCTGRWPWRSALAVSLDGQLLYVAATPATPSQLAAVVAAAGGVEAMQLDINPQWVTFDSFAGRGSTLAGTKLLGAMTFPTDHFLRPYFRDFLAAFAT